MLRTLVFLLFFCLKANAQNLVMNPSFEEHYSCDFGFGAVAECKHVFNPVHYSVPSTSDYFHACMTEEGGVPNTGVGYQIPRTGEAFLGIITSASNYQEYVQLKLNTVLLVGVEYEFSFYLSLSDRSRYAADDIHVKFVSDSIVYSEVLHEFMIPDWKNEEGNYIIDTMGWTKLSGSFTAIGTERWMIIGCFYGADEATELDVYPENSESAYYFIDDVTVSEQVLDIPNVFSPNDDGVNDLWEIEDEVNEVSIYNRWGHRVYYSTGGFAGWNGNNSNNGVPCNEGVYFYLVSTTSTEDWHKGFLTLLR